MTRIANKLLQMIRDRYPVGTYYLKILGDGISREVAKTDMIPEYHTSRKDAAIGLLGGGLLYVDRDTSKDPLWAPIVHKDYREFEPGDEVARWRDSYSQDWDAIGEIPLPGTLGVHVVEETSFTQINTLMIQLKGFPGWLPASLFKPIKEEFYTQTKRGTASLNDNSYGKDKHNQGSVIEVCRPVAAISSGKRTTGSGISGRGNAATIGRGHSSHTQITGK